MENLSAGQMIGPYRIIQQIGQGGMATVYKAYQPAMDRYVALKILPRQLAESPEFSGRFQQEARTIAHLEHAHILPVYDYGTSDSFTYLVMRFVEAGTLKDRLEVGPLSSEAVDKYFVQLTDALDYAHAHGVVHRDLKPSNVLLDARGDLFLTDFGIAKLLETDSRFTGTGALIGTPAYMSPEQAQGLAIDQRTDIYSLGIMLYEMVTERLPFEADTPLAIILKQISAPLPLPSSLKPGISPAIEQLLLKALAKNPADRFATAAEFAAAWKAAQRAQATRIGLSAPVPSSGVMPPASGVRPPAAGVPPAAPPPSGPISGPVPAAAPAAAPRRRRTPLLAAGGLLAVGLVACLALLVILVLSQLNRLNPSRPTASPTLFGGQPATVTAAAAATLGLTPSGPGPAAGLASGPDHWKSWTGANYVDAITVFNGRLVSGGPGSLTIWNIADGSVISRVTTADGLPSPYVQALLRDDSTHSLWIGTANGLVAFDGQKGTLYDNSSGLDSNNVLSVARGPDNLLAGTESSGTDGGGLNEFDGSRWGPVPDFPSAANTDSAPDKLSTTVYAILGDSEGNLWVGTDHGLGFFDGQTWKVYLNSDGLPADTVSALVEISGTVWAGTSNGLAQFDGSTFKEVPETDGTPILGLFADDSGNIWATSYGGIGTRAAAGGRWISFDKSNFPANTVYAGLPGPDGKEYFASDAGVLRFDGRAFDLWAVPNVPTWGAYDILLPGPDSSSLWAVESNGAHVDQVDLSSIAWTKIARLPCDSCVPLARAPDGKVWAGSGDGMWVLDADNQNGTHLQQSDGLPGSASQAVAFGKDGTVWIGTDGGVAEYVKNAVKTVYDAAGAGLADDTVHNLLAAADGSLWVSTDTDLSQRTPDGKWVHYGPGQPFQSDIRVTALAEDAAGAIWVTTYGEGVYRFAGGAWTQFRPGIGGVRLPSNNVNSVLAAADGSLWFGTDGAGAARFDGAGWQAITVSDGLISPYVYAIHQDSTGRVWLATGGGLTAYQP